MTKEELIKNHGMSLTESRLSILEMFLDAPGALTHADVEKASEERFDRVTIYRTLQTFVDKGIIHQVPTTNNSILYALCHRDCALAGNQDDNHVHFICNNCGNTSCLDGITVPMVKLPEGFSFASASMNVNGICAACK